MCVIAVTVVPDARYGSDASHDCQFVPAVGSCGSFVCSNNITIQ